MRTRTPQPRKISDAHRGNVSLEFALILPLLVMLLLGIIEFGRAMQVGQMVTNVAREGARGAIVSGSYNSEIESLALARLQGLLGLSSGEVAQCYVDITVDAAAGNPDPGDEVGNATSGDICRVQITVPYGVTEYTSLGILSSAEFLGVSAMRHE